MDIHVGLGLLIPVVFFGFTGMVKSLVKSQWTWGNFYLGIDVALAAFANAIVNIADSMHEAEKIPDPNLGRRMSYTVVCIVISFAALLVTMGLHQKFDGPREIPGNRQWVRGISLGVIGNLAGIVVLGLFIYWKLKGQV